MVLIIDNYDSFTYNLYQMAGSVRPDVEVVLNDAVGVGEIEAMNPSHLIFSPGAGRPADAGICEEAVRYFAGRLPMLGVCLGHQAICETFGARITYAKTLMHGKRSAIHVANGNPIFRGLPPRVMAGRYHLLAADRAELPDELLVIAEADDDEVMGVAHRDYDIFGLQFHPESILTPDGAVIMENFLSIGERCDD